MITKPQDPYQPSPYQNAQQSEGRIRLSSDGSLGIGGAVSGTLNASRTIISMSVETAVNGYIVILNGERFIAHKPSEVTELLTKRIATAHLED